MNSRVDSRIVRFQAVDMTDAKNKVTNLVQLGCVQDKVFGIVKESGDDDYVCVLDLPDNFNTNPHEKNGFVFFGNPKVQTFRS